MSIALRLLHAAVAIALVGWLATALIDRQAELAEVRQVVDQERTQTRNLRDDIARSEAVRNGLRRDDPYIVEFMARERLQYAAPGELQPPPRP